MKRFLTLFLMVCAVSAQAQRAELRVGAVATFNQTGYGYPELGYGGEVVATQSFGEHFRAGVGIQGYNMDQLGFVAPFFGTVGGQVGRFFIHADPGYMPISLTTVKNGVAVQQRGGFYFGGGVKTNLPFNLYLNVQYNDFPLMLVPGDSKRTSAIGVSLGYRFNK